MHSVFARSALALILVTLAIPALAKRVELQDEGQRALRLLNIAGNLQGGNNTEDLIKEAAKICGFAIWHDDRTASIAADPATKNGIAITDMEVTNYAVMFNHGQFGHLGDITSGVDTELTRIGVGISCKSYVTKWLQTGQFADNAYSRLTLSFIHDLAMHHNNSDDGQFTDQCVLDPVQTLFLMKVITEEAETAIWNAYYPVKKPDFQASITPYFVDEAPTNYLGTATDLAVGGFTGLYDEIFLKVGEAASKEGIDLLPTMVKLQKARAAVGPISSAVKFLSTYSFLGGDLQVEDADPTLIRTKYNSPQNPQPDGNVKTMVCRFAIDSSALNNFLGKMRPVFALAGMDLDQPGSGDLSGVETSWEFSDPEGTPKLVRWSDGQEPADAVLTGSDGKAHRKVEGIPQTRELDQNRLAPVHKIFNVAVTPAVKATSKAQNTVDVLLTLLPAKDLKGANPAAALEAVIINAVYEMLYRAKWQGTVNKTVQLQDWVDSDITTDISFEATGDASGDDGSHRLKQEHVHNVFEATTIPSKVKSLEDATTMLTPEQIAMIPPNMLEQIKADMAKKNAGKAKDPYLRIIPSDGGTARFLVDAYTHAHSTDPEEKIQQTTSDWNSKGSVSVVSMIGMNQTSFEIDIDEANKQAIVVIAGTNVGHMKMTSNGDVTYDDANTPVSVFTMTDLNKSGKKLLIPLTKDDNGEVIAYSGSTMVPFDLINGHAQGQAKISFRVVMRPKKT